MATKSAAAAAGSGGAGGSGDNVSNSKGVGGLGTPHSTAVPSRLQSSMTNPFEQQQPPVSSTIEDGGVVTRGERANSLADHPSALTGTTTATAHTAVAITALAGDGEKERGTASMRNDTAASTTSSSSRPHAGTVVAGAVLSSSDTAAAAAPSATTMADTNKSNQQQQQPSNSNTSLPQNQNPISTSSNNPGDTTNNSAAETISYSAERIIGNGSFGVVFQASVYETGEVVAIKKVLQDKRFKNRELQIMRLLVKDGHSNIVALKHCFYSQVSVLFVVVGRLHVIWDGDCMDSSWLWGESYWCFTVF